MRGEVIELDGPYGRKNYQKIAQGAFANIHRIVSEALPPHVLKKPSKSDIFSQVMYRHEIEIFTFLIDQFPHPNVIQLMDSRYETRIAFFERNTYIAFEYANLGDLQSYINAYPLSVQNRYQLLLGIAQGLDHLHTKCLVVHRDFKPENVVLDCHHDRIVPKIIDFGMARKLPAPNAVLEDVPNQGSACYVSPETLMHHRCSAKSDIYAFAILMYGMIALRTPLDWLLNSEMHEEVRNGFSLIARGYRENFYDFIPPADQQMIHDAWAPEPTDRPTAKQIVDYLQFALQHLELFATPADATYDPSKNRIASKWQGPKFSIFDAHSQGSVVAEVLSGKDQDENPCFECLNS